jgi:hypothetical protein
MENFGFRLSTAASMESASGTGESQSEFPLGPAGTVGTVGEPAKSRQQSGFVQFASEPGYILRETQIHINEQVASASRTVYSRSM